MKSRAKGLVGAFLFSGVFWAIAVSIVLGCARAQTVRVANYSGDTFSGWLRTTIDRDTDLPPAGVVGEDAFVLGRRLGSARVVDVRCTLRSGQLRSIELHKGAARDDLTKIGDLPAGIGWPVVAGTPLVPAAGAWLRQDGAAWLVHLHGRLGPMLHVDLWSWVYPDQGWARGELVVCASNPAVPDVVAVVPEGFRLEVGDAIVDVPGLPAGQPLLAAGDVLANGQARAFPFTLIWPHLLKPGDLASAGAAARWQLGAMGLERISPLGNPELPAQFDVRRWVAEHWTHAIGLLHTWSAGNKLGVPADATQTGGEEDQGFAKGAEAMHPLGAGAELVRYFVALNQMKRPCHHLEAWGQLLDLRRHPDLTFWQSQPHWHTGVSRDRLGKSRLPTKTETHGWWGPDDEHWLLNSQAFAARATGSPALQWELEAQGRCYLLQDTVRPGWATSGARAARARGWAGIGCVHLWENLEDRELAEAIRTRWRQRVAIYRTAVEPGDVWGTYTDQRVLSEVGGGAERARMPYQEAVGVFGVWLGCHVLGPADGVELAAAGARVCVRDGYQRDGAGRWLEWDFVRWPDPNYVEGQGAHRTGWYRGAWFPMGVWTAARAGDEKALEIEQVLRAEMLLGKSPLSWLPPR